MTTDTKSRNQDGFLNRLGSLLTGGRGWLEVSGYLNDDIRAEQPVRVLPGATVDGDIYAPRVVIGGLVKGYVVAVELLVEEGGQVWGDVYAGWLTMEPGGEIHGWLSAIDEEGYLILRAGGLARADGEISNGRDPRTGDGDGEDDGRLAILRRVRAKAAEALVARADLEQAFDEKLEETAGEKIAEAARLRQELIVARGDLLTAQERGATLEVAVQERDNRLQEQARRLSRLEEDLAGRNQTLADLESRYEQQSEARAEVEKRYKKTDIDLRAERVRADVLAGRVQNLETALQGSLQRAAEQQEALVRWQELAELAEGRVSELEGELGEAMAKLAEVGSVNDILRSRREKLEAELEDARQQLDTLHRQLLSTTPVTEEAKAALAVANKRIAELEAVLEDRTTAAARRKSELEETGQALADVRRKLDKARQTVGEQAGRLAEIEGEVDDYRGHAEEWKANVGRMTALLYESEERIKRLRRELDEAREAAQNQADTLRERVRQAGLQVEAMETEVERYVAEIEAQRKRMAEIQATLVEREVALKRVRADFDQQTLEIGKIRQLATNRIRRLEEEVAEARRQ